MAELPKVTVSTGYQKMAVLFLFLMRQKLTLAVSLVLKGKANRDYFLLGKDKHVLGSHLLLDQLNFK